MNKKIKAIELASRVYQRKDIPKKVKYNAVEYKYSEEFCDYENQLGNYLFSIITLRAYWMNEEVEILVDEEDNDISSLNAFKLMEAPYMAKCLDKNSHEEFMEHLKQSEVEIVHKIGELIEKVNKLDRKINKE